ncbi:MAG: hypothetical protein WA239_24985 [Candidatus Sulfotelmatobacter sp.]
MSTLPGVLVPVAIVIDGRRPYAPAPGSLVICDARAAAGGAKTASSGRQLIACSKAQAQTRQRALAADKGTSAQYLKFHPSAHGTKRQNHVPR